MSQYLDLLEVGDTVDIRGPSGKLTYLGRGEFHYPLRDKYCVLLHWFAISFQNTIIMPINKNSRKI